MNSYQTAITHVQAQALPWLALVENSLGSRVSAPVPWPSDTPPPPPNASWTVAELLPQGRRLAFRLVTIAELFPRFVEATQLAQWPKMESVVYLVELSTTPDTAGELRAKWSKSHITSVSMHYIDYSIDYIV